MTLQNILFNLGNNIQTIVGLLVGFLNTTINGG